MIFFFWNVSKAPYKQLGASPNFKIQTFVETSWPSDPRVMDLNPGGWGILLYIYKLYGYVLP